MEINSNHPLWLSTKVIENDVSLSLIESVNLETGYIKELFIDEEKSKKIKSKFINGILSTDLNGNPIYKMRKLLPGSQIIITV